MDKFKKLNQIYKTKAIVFGSSILTVVGLVSAVPARAAYEAEIASASAIFGSLAGAGIEAIEGVLTNASVLGLVVFVICLGIGLKWFFGSVRR